MTFRFVSPGRAFRLGRQFFGALSLALLCMTAALAANVVYEYDEVGRLRKATYDTGMVVTYGLDAAGNRTNVSTAMSAGNLQLSAATYSGGEASGQRTITITATRTGGSNGAVGVPYTMTAGTATAGSDYTASNGTLSWANGDVANKTFTITVLDDTANESSETVTVALGTPTGGASLGTPTSATVTISSDDSPGTLQLSASTYSGGEASGQRTITITATRVGGSGGAASVPYTITAGTATAGSDYTASNGTFSWATGDAANKTFTITVVDDTAVESGETLTVRLGTASGATLGTPNVATVTIASDDNPPTGTLQFATATYAGGEPAPARNITVIVTRLGGSFGAVSVPYTVTGVTATAGSDYTATASGTLSWANGVTAAQAIGITVLDDALFELSETVTVSLGTPTGTTLGTPSTATVTIGSDEPQPPVGSIQFTASSASVSEAGSSITITASRIGGSFGAIGASYATANGAATAGSDYTAANGTLNWADGDTANKSFTVTILDDSVYGGTGSFTATLNAPTGGASIGSPPSITVSILDNESGPTFSINSSSVNEGSTASLTVTLSGATALSHSVTYNSQVGSAAAPGDYSTIGSTLTFAPGETSKTITVSATNDGVFEGSEFYSVVLSSPTGNATISSGTGTVTINDVSSPPSFSINAVTQTEASTSMTLTITKSGASSSSHSVSYATSNGTATAGQDYTAVSGTLTFAPNESSKTFTVPVQGDGWWEGPSETFSVTLSNATGGATIVTPTVTNTLVEYAPAPIFTIQPTASLIETGGSVTLTVTRNPSFVRGPITVPYSTSNGTATGGSDYVATSGSVTFSSSEETETKSFTIPILNDAVTEGTENFFVSLGTPGSGGIVGSPSTATVSITEGGSVPSKPRWVQFLGCDEARLLSGACPSGFNDNQPMWVGMDYISTGTVTRYEVEIWGAWSTGWEPHYSGPSTSQTIMVALDSWWQVRVRACNQWGCSEYDDYWPSVSLGSL